MKSVKVWAPALVVASTLLGISSSSLAAFPAALIPQNCVDCQTLAAQQAQAAIAPVAMNLNTQWQQNVSPLVGRQVQFNFAMPTFEMMNKSVFQGLGELPTPPTFEMPYLTAQGVIVNHPSAPWNRVLGTEMGALMYQLTMPAQIARQ